MFSLMTGRPKNGAFKIILRTIRSKQIQNGRLNLTNTSITQNVARRNCKIEHSTGVHLSRFVCGYQRLQEQQARLFLLPTLGHGPWCADYILIDKRQRLKLTQISLKLIVILRKRNLRDYLNPTRGCDAHFARFIPSENPVNLLRRLDSTCFL